MTMKGRTEVCFILAALAIAGPWLYYDLKLGIKLLEPQQLQIIWGLSIGIMAVIISCTDGVKGNFIGTIMCLAIAPAAVITMILLGVWCVFLPVKTKKNKPRSEIGANVI